MRYLIVGYLVLGASLIFWLVPMYLKKKKADIIDPAEGAVWLLGAEDAGVGLILIGLVIWPVSVPVWIWSELSVVRERERFQREQILEEE